MDKKLILKLAVLLTLVALCTASVIAVGDGLTSLGSVAGSLYIIYGILNFKENEEDKKDADN